jgi:diguanylate cyclase (GGDEF)-like protein/PAS domain S-box-containing protein
VVPLFTMGQTSTAWQAYCVCVSNLGANNLASNLISFGTEGPSHRLRRIRVLFVHHDSRIVDECLQALTKAQFIVSFDTVSTLEQCAEQFGSQAYDVVVAEYPSPSWQGPKGLQLLHETVREIPLLFVTTDMASESIVELAAHGVFDCVEREHLAQLPLAVRQALNEKNLRDELEGVRRALRHSQSLYRALVDNPIYGIYRCDADGKLVDVNEALINMLGYTTKEELLAASQATELLSNLGKAAPWSKHPRETLPVEPVETEWKRKNGTMLKARVSGHSAFDDYGNFAGNEVIAIDVTEQRSLEEHLRHQASSDSLTGLANHRRLFEVLHAEICRSQRTGREFSLALLDLDGLKQINDRFSHPVGDRALCRLGQILKDSCRSIDTAARHGGDEFALVLPETNGAAATLLARRICELLERETEEPALSVSVGIACYPKNADTIGNLIAAADRALYAVKDGRPKIARAGGT